MAGTWIYRYEARGIQSFVLATERLREIAGASALVEGLSRSYVPASKVGGGLLPDNAEVLMAAAGSATVRFADEASLARHVVAWPLFVDRTAPGLRVVQGWAPVGEGGEEAAFATVRARLRQARQEVWPDLPEAGPCVARAGRTGLPATSLGRRGLEDRATEAKADERAEDALGSRLSSPRVPRFTRDTDAFGEGYLAVVHADGNDIGRLVQRAVGLGNTKALSTALSTATETAAKRAVADLAERAGWETRDDAPFRPIVLGGDDLTVITRATEAVPFVHRFLEIFEEETERAFRAPGLRELEVTKGLTACAGIAWVKSGHPFHQAYRLSEELCRDAKRRLRRADQPTPSGLLFHRVTVAAADPWDGIVQGELSANGAQGAGALVGGPWTVGRRATAATVADLADLVTALRDLPRGAFREWLRLTQGEPTRADTAWSRIREVGESRTRGAWAGLDRALKACGADPMTGWRQNGTTPIADAATWSALLGGDATVDPLLRTPA